MNNLTSNNLTKVLKAYGVVGVVTYVGGFVLLTGFIWEYNIQRLIMLGIVGVILLSLSIFIAYFRLKIQMEREKALIKMVQDTGNRLAESLGKSMTNEQTTAIIQKVRQNQRDLITAVTRNEGNKENHE